MICNVWSLSIKVASFRMNFWTIHYTLIVEKSQTFQSTYHRMLYLFSYVLLKVIFHKLYYANCENGKKCVINMEILFSRKAKKKKKIDACRIAFLSKIFFFIPQTGKKVDSNMTKTLFLIYNITTQSRFLPLWNTWKIGAKKANFSFFFSYAYALNGVAYRL